VYEYRLVKSGGGGMFKAGQIDEKKSQETLDKMSAEGWQLRSAFVEMQSGSSMNFCTVWERQKGS
jgi:hypothetical protein